MVGAPGAFTLLVHLPAPLWPAAFVLDLLTLAGVEATRWSGVVLRAWPWAWTRGAGHCPPAAADWIDIKRKNAAPQRLGLIH
jgi:hypothetical protein